MVEDAFAEVVEVDLMNVVDDVLASTTGLAAARKASNKQAERDVKSMVSIG